MPEPVSYSIVIPVFNEEAVLPILLRRLDLLLARFQEPAEVIFVDDGSSDSGPIVLQALARRDPNFRYVGLSRNFGHQIASRKGASEKPSAALMASRAILSNGYFVSPAARSRRWNATSVCRKPSQAIMPRTKRSCSGIWRRASSTLRSIKRKSPTSAGMPTEVIMPSSR